MTLKSVLQICIVFAILAGAILYSYFADDTFAGDDIFLAQGWSVPAELAHFSSNAKKELAANGFACPSFSAVGACYCHNPYAPWHGVVG